MERSRLSLDSPGLENIDVMSSLNIVETSYDLRYIFEDAKTGLRQGATMSERPDIAAYSPDNELVLIVEVKNHSGASQEWVIQMRRNLMDNSAIPQSRFFILAMPDYFYLWKNTSLRDEEAEPDYKIDAREALRPYIERTSLSLDNISEQGLELLVASWLSDLANSDLSGKRANPEFEWLFDSGLYESIRNGSVRMEAAA